LSMSCCVFDFGCTCSWALGLRPVRRRRKAGKF
jgi:hypothetical protein